MFSLEFYETKQGKSPAEDFSENSKKGNRDSNQIQS